MSGYGVLTESDGSEYKGQFILGEINGEGIYRDAKTGNTFEGSNWRVDEY